MRKIRKGTSLLGGREGYGTSQRCSEGTVGFEEESEAGVAGRGECPRDWEGPAVRGGSWATL